MIFNPSNENEKAGLLIFLNENHFYLLCKSIADNKPAIQLYRAVEKKNSESVLELMSSENISDDQSTQKINLRIDAEGQYYSFFYAFADDEWIPLKENVDGVYLRAVIPRDFIGCVFAMYATSQGSQSKNTAYFDWFEYMGNDEVYK